MPSIGKQPASESSGNNCFGSAERKVSMATPVTCPDQTLALDVRTRLAEVPSIREAYLQCGQSALSIWVGVAEDDRDARRAVYGIEDALIAQHRDVILDFHVVPLSIGRSLREFVSAARPIFQRDAA